MNLTRWGHSLCAAIVVILLAAPRASASLPPRSEQAVLRYLAELKRVEAAMNRTSLEPLFAMADTLEQYLCYGRPLADSYAVPQTNLSTIEDLSGSEYEALRDRLRSLLLNRDEVVFATPDSGYFLPLARAKGLQSDRAFMEVYFKTLPVAGWPIYVQQQTDYSGCRLFGTGIMVKLYGSWRQFRTRFPGRYEIPAKVQLDEIGDTLKGVICPCAGSDSVVRELEMFLRRFPDDDMAAKIRDELKEVKEGRSNARFNCISG